MLTGRVCAVVRRVTSRERAWSETVVRGDVMIGMVLLTYLGSCPGIVDVQGDTCDG